MPKGRPKPNILINHIDPKTYIQTDICESKTIYVVVYKDAAFNVRKHNNLLDLNHPGNITSYRSSAFSTPGHAHVMANKMNDLFKCQDFKVVKLNPKDGEDV